MAPVIDFTHALDQAGGSEELAKDLFKMLANELPDLNNKLGVAIQNNDHQAMWDHAHKLYGSTAYCGVPALNSAAKNLEQAIKDNDSDNILASYDAVNEAVKDIIKSAAGLLEQSWQ